MLKGKSGLDWVWDGLEISESTSMHLYEHRYALLIIGDSRWSMTKKERCFSLYAGTGQDSGFPFLSDGTDPEIGEHTG